MELVLYIIGGIFIWWLSGLLAIALDIWGDRYSKVVTNNWQYSVAIWFLGPISLILITFQWVITLSFDLWIYLKIPKLHFWIYQKLKKNEI